MDKQVHSNSFGTVSCLVLRAVQSMDAIYLYMYKRTHFTELYPCAFFPHPKFYINPFKRQKKTPKKFYVRTS